MIETLAISLWSYMFCGPWSEYGKAFGWLKAWATYRLPYVVRHPLIECGMCHAVWVAAGLQAWRLAHGATFDAGNILMILGASFGALILQDFETLMEKWKNS